MATKNPSNDGDRVRQNYRDAAEFSAKSVRVWNELLAASTDMAFDVVLKNWNYSRSLRGSAEQAIEEAIKTQHRLTSEMMQVWQGYTDRVEEIVKKTAK